MKVFLILLGFSLCKCDKLDKLDRSYLPPPGSKYSGGTDEYLQTPLESPLAQTSSDNKVGELNKYLPGPSSPDTKRPSFKNIIGQTQLNQQDNSPGFENQLKPTSYPYTEQQKLETPINSVFPQIEQLNRNNNMGDKYKTFGQVSSAQSGPENQVFSPNDLKNSIKNKNLMRSSLNDYEQKSSNNPSANINQKNNYQSTSQIYPSDTSSKIITSVSHLNESNASLFKGKPNYEENEFKQGKNPPLKQHYNKFDGENPTTPENYNLESYDSDKTQYSNADPISSDQELSLGKNMQYSSDKNNESKDKKQITNYRKQPVNQYAGNIRNDVPQKKDDQIIAQKSIDEKPALESSITSSSYFTPTKSTKDNIYKDNFNNTENTIQSKKKQSDRSAVILNYENNMSPEGYAYSFDTSNGIHVDENGTTIQGTKAKGSFSYTGDDGKVYSVEYYADENGFQPKGDHLPTPPPIPKEILQVIQQAEANKKAGIFHDGSYDDNKYGYKNYMNGQSTHYPGRSSIFEQKLMNGYNNPLPMDGDGRKNNIYGTMAKSFDKQPDEFNQKPTNNKNYDLLRKVNGNTNDPIKITTDANAAPFGNTKTNFMADDSNSSQMNLKQEDHLLNDNSDLPKIKAFNTTTKATQSNKYLPERNSQPKNEKENDNGYKFSQQNDGAGDKYVPNPRNTLNLSNNSFSTINYKNTVKDDPNEVTTEKQSKRIENTNRMKILNYQGNKYRNNDTKNHFGDTKKMTLEEPNMTIYEYDEIEHGGDDEIKEINEKIVINLPKQEYSNYSTDNGNSKHFENPSVNNGFKGKSVKNNSVYGSLQANYEMNAMNKTSPQVDVNEGYEYLPPLKQFNEESSRLLPQQNSYFESDKTSLLSIQKDYRKNSNIQKNGINDEQSHSNHFGMPHNTDNYRKPAQENPPVEKDVYIKSLSPLRPLSTAPEYNNNVVNNQPNRNDALYSNYYGPGTSTSLENTKTTKQKFAVPMVIETNIEPNGSTQSKKSNQQLYENNRFYENSSTEEPLVKNQEKYQGEPSFNPMASPTDPTLNPFDSQPIDAHTFSQSPPRPVSSENQRFSPTDFITSNQRRNENRLSSHSLSGPKQIDTSLPGQEKEDDNGTQQSRFSNNEDPSFTSPYRVDSNFRKYTTEMYTTPPPEFASDLQMSYIRTVNDKANQLNQRPDDAYFKNNLHSRQPFVKTEPSTVGEDFTGPKQKPSFDAETGYHY